MYRPILLVLAFLLLVPALATADDNKKTPEYQSTTLYAGMYKAERLYQLDERNNLWRAHRRPPVWATISCGTARNALRNEGIWTGNLSDTGECHGYDEAPTYATGNYLNYLNSVRDRTPDHSPDKDD